MPQHWPVDLVEKLVGDLDLVLRGNAEQVAVKRGVVDLAK
jgi:hypothetical protein